ncbi:Glucose-repressible protein Grg1 [Phaffia rhodozyma]|uniref:Glucose-repressible protein Grg1 n=1 Tax=Phaffia rhodozyma TaxID=264483 RepID=Q9C1U6_PHARH|nr:Grg1 protein [Phaffia rhodozyma]CED85052.1 Glucose-repressible protein Grg1 [Phaffia rhodozyma]
MESIKTSISNAANYASETVNQATSATSKEANKEVAKDSNAGVGTRINAGIDALGDKADETSSDAKSKAYKQNI